jgi:hypothetical protein
LGGGSEADAVVLTLAAVPVVVVPVLGCCCVLVAAVVPVGFTPGFDLDAFPLRLAPFLESKPVLPIPIPC